MFEAINTPKLRPYEVFLDYYAKALKLKQSSIEAMVVSSFSKELNQTNSRFVNLKIINSTDFIFFSNYESPKAKEFILNNRVSCLFFWNKINLQIRMNGIISKTDSNFSDDYFLNRSTEKNALAVSSNQSNKIKSYQSVKDKYKATMDSDIDLNLRPDYWGGYSFKPYYFEFWEGQKYRLNKRTVYECFEKDNWKKSYLEP